MSSDADVDHDVTDGRLFFYVISLWVLGIAALLLLVKVAVAVGATVPPSLLVIIHTSFGLLFVGVYYERVITGLARAILWVHPTAALEDGDQA